jgi:hypothetical protein
VRLFRRRRSGEAEVSEAVSAALGQPVAFNHLQYHGGALSGTVDVADAAAFEAVLRTAYDVLAGLLGDDVERVVFYLSGSTPTAEPVTAESLGLPVPPSGHDLAQRFG